MLQESTAVNSEPRGDSTAHVVHALMQFLMAVRYRKNVVIAALMVAGLVGGLYYMTATPYYRSGAAILVMGSGGSDGSPVTVPADGARQQSLMRTLQNLLTRDKVVEGAVKYLQPEDCIDMAGAPQEAWPAIIRGGLSSSVNKGTRIIEVGYRSKDPKAAVAVVNAVVQSYRNFLDDTHGDSAAEFRSILTTEKDDLAVRLFQKEQELVAARTEMHDFGIRSSSPVTHPLVERAVYFNKTLIETQKERITQEATLAAIESADRNGEDLQQHIMTVANVVGGEILMRSLGFDHRDSYTQSVIERQLLDDRANLKAMQEHLGPAHPDVTSAVERIRLNEQYLMTYRQRIKDRARELQRTELGRMLIQMVRQKLNETWQLEASLQAKFDQAQADAVRLNAQLTRLEIIEHDLDWLRNLQDTLLERIAKIKVAEKGPEIRTTVVQEPTEATRPFSPNLRRVLMMTLAGGIAAGLILVYVLDTLDDRFRSAEEMQQQMAVPVLAMVRQLEVNDTQGIGALQMHVAPNSTECEAFRTLRTALALADNEARHIVISSAEPGDGKTTVLANLAVSYAQSEKRTLLIDADLRRPGLTAMMGMRGIDGLSSVIRSDQKVVEMATRHIQASGIAGLDVLPSGPRPTNPAELLANPRFSELLAWAETVYDQILIDSPPALATSDAAVIGRLVDGVVIVVQPDKNRRRMVLRATDSLACLKIPLLGIVVNRIGADGDPAYYGYGDGYGYGYGYGGNEDEESFDSRDELRPPEKTSPEKTSIEKTSTQQDVPPRRVA